MNSFKKIYIEITNVCNLACDFCPETKRSPKFLDINDFIHILDEVKPYGKYIYLHVKGEPLLHPEIASFLDVCHENGFYVNITTNGTLINKVKETLLAKPPVRQINFSLHSFDGNDAPYTMDEYLDDIFSFVNESLEKTNIIHSLRLWNLQGTVEDTQVNSVQNQNILEKIQNAFPLEFNLEEQVKEKMGVKLLDKLYLNQEYEFQWPDINAKEDDGVGFCYGLRNQIAILVDGTVVPCCLDGNGIISLGNIKEQSLTSILESERVKNIQDSFSKSYACEELCRKCGYRRRFNSQAK